jgi:16S rRNA G527 N7-methylase RsmG
VSSPTLRESVDVVSVRAVRVDTRDLMTLQTFLKPGGSLLVFKGSGADDVATSAQPPLQWQATHTLLEPINSRLVVLEKAQVRVRQ